MVDGLKALDPERPVREVDIAARRCLPPDANALGAEPPCRGRIQPSADVPSVNDDRERLGRPAIFAERRQRYLIEWMFPFAGERCIRHSAL